MLTVLMSVIVLVLETHRDFRVPFDDGSSESGEWRTSVMEFGTNVTNHKLVMYLTSDVHVVLFVMDIICNVIFTVDLTLRFVSCPKRKAFCKHILNILDFVSVLTVWIGTIIELSPGLHGDQTAFTILQAVTILYSLRVARFFRLCRQSTGLRVMFLVFKASWKELVLLCVSFFIAAVIFATAMFYVELNVDSVFPDMLISMWWAIVTMTTVGYGDHYPTSFAGRVVGSVCSLSGLLLLALPIAIIASNFSDFYAHNKDRESQVEELGSCLCCKKSDRKREYNSTKVKPHTDDI
jgi:hypothetical protein